MQNLVIAYGDANALRRGVAHAVLRDVLLHGPLEPEGASLADDPAAWVEAFATMRAEWLAAEVGVPVDVVRPHVATPLRAVLANVDLPIELVIDEEPCVDCALATRLIGAVAHASGSQLVAPADVEISWQDPEAWRAEATAGLLPLLDAALRETGAAGGSVSDAWDHVRTAGHGYGIADLGTCMEFTKLLASDAPPARLVAPASPDDLVRACATGSLAELRLEPANG